MRAMVTKPSFLADEAIAFRTLATQKVAALS
jgi:hypothetical protein